MFGAVSGKLGYGSFKSWGTGCCWGLGRCWVGTGSKHGLGLGLLQAERVSHPLSGISKLGPSGAEQGEAFAVRRVTALLR